MANSNKPFIDQAYCQTAIKHVLQKIDENLDIFTYKYPAPASVNLVYPAIDNVQWTSSFWTGMLWLAYEVTGDDKYRKVAEIQLEDFTRQATNRICTDTHDLGFLFTLSCVAAFRLTGNEQAKETAIKAADLLMERYFEKAGIIQAWGNLNDPEERGRMIIDCCMNLPLLYWATEVTGNPSYHKAAYNHAKKAAQYLVREDATTFHTYYVDVLTGEPRFGKTNQGFSDDSCWARGQAWALYGFPLSYKYTKAAEFLETNKRVTQYFLERMPKDLICYWDLMFVDGPEERDSSAAVIAACGMLEHAKYLPVTDETKSLYEITAMQIVHSLTENYTTKNTPESNGILLHAVYGKPHNSGVDECCIWGDYYYFEALVRLTKDWQLYW
ncbi:glycoside hydrolase family 88 protein [Paenibacillus sedimenti]|uniref:Glycoside hydrolase family 88 protein n=1 Tax=Paenibacillus sedimenti TaxID=2770274 RepID=A0A926KND4_9BACL|nr:glycoside hydrolase family 88 protein [Paenibacillus sedimenti]MBD0380895.1 glycoside hydrolase family 88 protein [Paenibacillus sedimenti]